MKYPDKLYAGIFTVVKPALDLGVEDYFGISEKRGQTELYSEPMNRYVDVAYMDVGEGGEQDESKPMATGKYHACFERLDKLEQALCCYFNHMGDWPYVEKFFAMISRIGNGVFWYVLMIIMPVADSVNGLIASLHMAAVGLACLVIYQRVKNKLVRQRPYLKWSNIRNGTAPLDLYSFPSGHTLHAVAFTIVALSYYPMFSPLLVSITLLIALSRVILGLHYPSDVLVGALIGTAVALFSFCF